LAARIRYLEQFDALIALAQNEGMNVVVVVKMPVLPLYYSQLPDEKAFDRALADLLAARSIFCTTSRRRCPRRASISTPTT
jgi:hypothetical protein